MLKDLFQHPLIAKHFGQPVEKQGYLLENSFSALSAFLCTYLLETTNKHVVLISSEKEENNLFLDLDFFAKDKMVELPAWDTLDPKFGLSKEITGQKNKVLLALQKGKKIIVTTPAGICQKIPSAQESQNQGLVLKVGEKISPDELVLFLQELGYENSPVVYDKGQYALRRYVVDFFDVAQTSPIRVEFWGDEIEAIRSFDPSSQKSLETISEVTLTLADPTKSTSYTLFEYLKKECIVVFEDLLSLEDRIAFLKKHPTFHHPLFVDFETIFPQIQENSVFYLAKEPLHTLTTVQRQKESLVFDMFGKKIDATHLTCPLISMEKGFYSHDAFHIDTLDTMIKETLSHIPSSMKLMVVCDNHKHQTLIEQKLHPIENEKLQLEYQKGSLTCGLMMKDQSIGILSSIELFHIQRVRRQKQREIYAPRAEVYMPVPGDMVVHFYGGVGRYTGIEKNKDHLGRQTEFLVLEYAKGSKMFVPMSQAHLITPYVGVREEQPKLSELGSKKWEKTKQLVEKQIIGYAKELLELYASRTDTDGFCYLPDTEEFKEFENTFPYVETKDQLQAITSVKQDMTSAKCMDRLVCGDVGYGKTEVALRAAVKAALDGPKQVAILVPTTVLAIQHFENFKQRCKDFPIRIEQLSRLGGTKKNKEVLQGLKEGTIDIVIGTHRILSKDVQFANLGLLIIDEEQRFGVRAKEKLKLAKHNIDTLTLSATPIPRTLYLAMNQAKDLSMIQTPPQDRLPIRTILCQRDEDVIQTAIERELGRGGQVFFIHNRVESIYKQKELLEKLAPGSRILVGHGQMGAEELDEIFHEFKQHNADILVATSIVENGIDIPNANTIIIDRADRFGLSDLYQLRGRVGRWNKEAFAYFLTPEKTLIREDAKKRLMAVVEASSFGGGLKIAMRDLEIRGAGNLLGTQQSGQVASVGFHLYCRLLKKTINKLQGKKTSFAETKIDFPFTARLGSSYIPSEELRMEMYRRLGETDSANQVDQIFEELQDRFGKPPEEAVWLYYMMRLRAYANQKNMAHVKIKERTVVLISQKGRSVERPWELSTDPKSVEMSICGLIDQLA